LIETFMTLSQAVVQPVVQPNSFLTLHYRLGGPAGDIINTFNDKPATLSLGTGELSPAVEQCLLGLQEGSRASFDLPAGAAFGERNPAMQQWVAAKLLRELGDAQEVYHVGDVVQFPTPDGQGSYAGVVLQVGGAEEGKQSAKEGAKEDAKEGAKEGGVLFDFNHPLAGQPVSFEVHVIGVL
jgi:FKBP-type peptidyl-prolyl cis-trans isomerase SlpA